FRRLAAFGMAAALGAGAAQAQDAVPQKNDPWYQDGQARLQEALQNQPNTNPAKNVIIFIADGMGVSSVTAARIWQGQQAGNTGEENFLSWEKFPNVAMVKTYNTNQQVADSAGTATAWLTGVKAQAGMISGDSTVKRGDCDSMKGHEARTLLQLGELAGLATGTISTARLTHATPASSYAHAPDRDFEDDTKLEKAIWKGAGCKDIASQLIEFEYGDGIEVAMGGGRRHFIPKEMADPEDAPKTGGRGDGRDLTKEWLQKYDNKGAAYVWNTEQFNAIDVANTNALLGLFDRSHMEYEADRDKDRSGEPSLAEMTAKSIEILSKNTNGYILQVEGGRVDHANHATNAARMLADAVAVSDAVEVAMKMVNLEETLIIVTADHSHVLTISGYPQRGNPILGLIKSTDKKGGGPLDELALGDDGKPYTTLSYTNGSGAWEDGTPRPDLSGVDTTDVDYIQQTMVPRKSETHAGEDVALWAQGPGAWLFQGTIEQNYIYHVIDHALSLTKRAGGGS
ncbi:MAG: alkaline phosphatase, partial [Gammaproteobacteria bacterium]